MEPNRIALIVVALAATLFASGCGTKAGALCDRAVECGSVEEDGVDQCRSDINDAVGDKKLKRSQVRKCMKCSYDHSCGADIVRSCNEECEGLWIYISVVESTESWTDLDDQSSP